MRKLVLPFLLVFLFSGCAGTVKELPLRASPYLTLAPSPEKTPEPIRILPEELMLTAGETASLDCQSMSGQSFNDVVWTIEDERIAAISETGMVTAVAIGKTTAIAVTASGIRAACPVTVGEQKQLVSDGSMIEINEEIPNFVAQDGTKCTMIFEMQAISDNGVFKGQAMLRSVGVKDTGGSLPATAMLKLVSAVEFSLSPSDSEEPPAANIGGNEVTLMPLVDIDYLGKGTFRFILTDVGFMALETELQDNDIFLKVPFEVIVAGDTVGIGFSAPDGQFLSFHGKLTKKP